MKPTCDPILLRKIQNLAETIKALTKQLAHLEHLRDSQIEKTERKLKSQWVSKKSKK